MSTEVFGALDLLKEERKKLKPTLFLFEYVHGNKAFLPHQALLQFLILTKLELYLPLFLLHFLAF